MAAAACVGPAFVCVTGAAGGSLTGRMGTLAAGTGLAAAGVVAAGVATTGSATAVVLADASAPAARVCVTPAVVRFASEAGVLRAVGAGGVLAGAILPDAAGACAGLGSAVSGLASSLGPTSGFAAGPDVWAASTLCAATRETA